MLINTNLSRLREGLEQISLLEAVLIHVFEKIPIGIIIVEYPSRKCIITNETFNREISPVLIGKKIFIHSDYIINENGQRFDCHKSGSFSFIIGERQFRSFIVSAPKERPKEVLPSNGQQSPIWI